MTIGRICQRDVDLVDSGEPIKAAAQRMAARNVGSLLVLDDRRRPIGLVTDRDIALRVVAAGADPCCTRVRDVMTVRPESVGEDIPIEEALAVMRSLGVRRLPVVDCGGALAGVVSVDDILALLATEFGDVSRILERSSPRALAET